MVSGILIKTVFYSELNLLIIGGNYKEHLNLFMTFRIKEVELLYTMYT